MAAESPEFPRVATGQYRSKAGHVDIGTSRVHFVISQAAPPGRWVLDGTFRDSDDAGVRVREVREVRDLAEGAVWVEESRLLLIDADLTSAAREDVSRQALGMFPA